MTATEYVPYHEGRYGDPRRCPRHPGVETSSADGMFDAPCYVCEGEMADESDEYEDDSVEARLRIVLRRPGMPAAGDLARLMLKQEKARQLREAAALALRLANRTGPGKPAIDFSDIPF